MLKDLLNNELIQLSVEVSDEEEKLAEVMAGGCGAQLICLGTFGGKGNGNCDLS